MRRGIILLLVLFLIGALSGVNAQELTVSDIEFIDEGYNHEHPLIILTKEGSALNVQLMNYSAHPYTEEFVITPKMSGGSDGEPCSVSIGVSYINHSIAAIITMFNVSFNVHGIEANSFYFSCWWYKGMVSLTEGEPLELWENRNISKDGVTYTLDNKTKTATLSSGRHVEGEYNIPSELDYGGQAFTLTSINYPAFAFNTSLTSVIIPKNVTNIGNAVFYRCSNLTDVYCYAENVPETGINVFNDSPIASATLHVPAGSVDKFKATEPWSGFGNIVATASDVQSSGCLNNTRAGSNSTKESISLLKEGNILTVNLHNYWSQCATEDFEVTPSVSESNNGDPYTVSVKVKSIGENEADCICPYNISFTIHGVEADSFYFDCWWFKGQVNLTEGEQLVLSNEYYPEGTKWTEIRLDTLKYDSWYSKVGDEWVPNYETIEYYVKGEHENKYWESPFKCVYTNGPEWTDSLTLLIYEGKVHGYDMGILATVPVPVDDDLIPWPGEAYYFDWRVGMTLKFVDILSNNTTAIYPPGTFDFGKIEEIKEGEFGGVKQLKYTDINGVRIIQGIGVTTWNDGECLFGPVKPYRAWSLFKEDYTRDERNYRSMLVHFERNGEVLYDVWPAKETVSYTKDQMATIILPTEPDASKGKYYRLDRCEKGKIIFEEELSPKARTPYIIVPKEDFCIDLNTLDLVGLLRDTVSVKGASFIGSYSHEELSCQDGFYIDIIDATPDCQADDSNQRKAIVGALRACLIVNWDDPYNPGGSKGITEKREIVLLDNGTSLTPNPSPVREGSIYDLSGRKINSQFSTFNSQFRKKGLYIQNGVKRVVR